MGIKKGLLIIVGWLAVILAALGVILPILPTTPFLLLAAWCFSHSSPRFYQWLLYRSWFGGYIRYWQTYRGLPKGAKPKAIIMILITFSLSLWAVSIWWVRLILLVILCWLLIFMIRLPVIAQPMMQNPSKDGH